MSIVSLLSTTALRLSTSLFGAGSTGFTSRRVLFGSAASSDGRVLFDSAAPSLCGGFSPWIATIQQRTYASSNIGAKLASRRVLFGSAASSDGRVLFGSAAPTLCGGVSPSLATIQQRTYASSNRGASKLSLVRVVFRFARSLPSGVYAKGGRAKCGRHTKGGRSPKGPSKSKRTQAIEGAIEGAYSCNLCSDSRKFVSMKALRQHQAAKHPNQNQGTPPKK